MNGLGVLFLGVIAVATLATAILQVGLLVYATRLARRVTRLVDEVDRELKPLLASANAVGRDAARVSALAAVQAERADRMCADLAAGVGEALGLAQRAIAGPARDGLAILAALRAFLSVFRGSVSAGKKRGDEDEALFI